MFIHCSEAARPAGGEAAAAAGRRRCSLQARQWIDIVVLGVGAAVLLPLLGERAAAPASAAQPIWRLKFRSMGRSMGRRPPRRRQASASPQPSPQETPAAATSRALVGDDDSASPLWTSSSQWPSQQKAPAAATIHALVGVGVASAQNSAAGKYIE